ncbi:hypothetical protein F2Q70_00015230 [Brassica cretica]|uniref:Uncharacterized protein n=1 Tax=Brassica cretica TaxID=69181 RepID=A0A3N6RI40_BRACR|nr:hypothetical protein F2Q70_00015230 [Brassica cretica]KAF2598290.1 hypothetical protein F2Q68_00008326 [Brassica cretica]
MTRLAVWESVKENRHTSEMDKCLAGSSKIRITCHQSGSNLSTVWQVKQRRLVTQKKTRFCSFLTGVITLCCRWDIRSNLDCGLMLLVLSSTVYL